MLYPLPSRERGMTRLSQYKSELSEVGEQTLINGVRPVTLGEKLTAMTGHPMRPKRNPQAPQKSCDIGLFDEAGRAQIDLCDLIKTMERSNEPS